MWGVLNPVKDAVENIEMTGEVYIVRSVRLGVIALSLLLKHVQLDMQVRVSLGRLQFSHNLEQFQTWNRIIWLNLILYHFFAIHDIFYKYC